MTPEPRDELTVEFTPARGPRRRVRFEPRVDGRHWRYTEVWTGCSWREEGRELVDDVAIDAEGVMLP